jgi:dynein light intermediate chain
MSIIAPTSSLVRYDNPALVTRNTDKRTPKVQSLIPLFVFNIPNMCYNFKAKALKSSSPTPMDGSMPLNSPSANKKLQPLDSKNLQQTDEILNSILPPREWTEGNQLWVQHVSSTPATRLDVINLQEQLDMRLQQRQARETGICPVRRELYSQCFGISKSKCFFSHISLN